MVTTGLVTRSSLTAMEQVHTNFISVIVAIILAHVTDSLPIY